MNSHSLSTTFQNRDSSANAKVVRHDMSQRHSAVPHYGSQFPNPLYYPYPTNERNEHTPLLPPQSIHHQNLPTLAQNINVNRYDSNAQAPSPALPLNFPLDFNPEVFKQIAGSHLPPPPPPVNLGSMPFPNGPYTPLQPLQQPQPQQHTVSPAIHHENKPQDTKRSISASGDNGLTGYPFQEANRHANTLPSYEHQPSYNAAEPNAPTTQLRTSTSREAYGYGLDGSSLSTSFRPSIQSTIPGIGQNLEDDAQHASESPNIGHAAGSNADMRERAKAAVQALASAGIDYQDLVDEGVDSHVLERLYQDLSLQTSRKRKRTEEPTSNKPQSLSTVHTILPATGVVEEAPKNDDIQRQPDQGMERKDRIAKLLAAKRGQSSSGGKASQSASPVPEQPASVVPNAKQSYFPKPHNTTDSGLEPQRNNINSTNTNPTASKSGRKVVRSVTETSLSSQLTQRNFLSAIPGLSMTSDEPFDRQHGFQTDSVTNLSPHVGHEDSDDSKHEYDPMQPLLEISRQQNKSGRQQSIVQASTSTSNVHRLPAFQRRFSQPNGDLNSDNDDDRSLDIEDGEYEPTLDESKLSTLDRVSSIENTALTSVIPPVSQPEHSNSIQFDMNNRTSTAMMPNDQRTTPALSGTISLPEMRRTEADVFPNIASVASPLHGSSVQDASPTMTPSVAQSSSTTMPGDSLDKRAARMAALKAQLLQKASRKRTLQGVVSPLDSESQMSRFRLKEARESLLSVQAQIELKMTELDQVKQAERDLLLEIKSLEEQVENVEAGQNQPAHEKLQPNDSATFPPATREKASYFEERSNQDDTLHQQFQSTANAQVNETLQEQVQVGYGSTAEHDVISTRGPSEVVDAESMQRTPSSVQLTDEHKEPVSRKGQTLSPSASDTQNNTNTRSGSDDVEESDDDRMSIDESDGASDGSASMSDSGSDDYEPAEPGNIADTDAESDDYEPPDMDLDASEKDTNKSEEHGELVDAPQPDTNDARSVEQAEDLFDQASSNVKDETMANSSSATPTVQKPMAPNSAWPESTVDNHGHALPLSEANTLINQQDIQTSSELRIDSNTPLGLERDPSSPRFMPYQSPLSALKSFRFHPQFNELVKNGYRSLTYSNQIDSKLPLCPTELAGQVCTDNTCEEQHFGSMALSDEKILVQMSSANDLKDKSQRDEYLIGLKKVIADMRERGVKEFSEVADALSKYRREWTESRLASAL